MKLSSRDSSDAKMQRSGGSSVCRPSFHLDPVSMHLPTGFGQDSQAKLSVPFGDRHVREGASLFGEIQRHDSSISSRVRTFSYHGSLNPLPQLVEKDGRPSRTIETN